MPGTKDRVVSDPPVDAPDSSTSSSDAAVEQLRSDVARAVRKICPRWLADEAEDVAQVAVSRVLSRIRATAGTIAWTQGYLYRAAHSALVDEIRRRRRLREVPLEPEVHQARDPIDPERHARGVEIRSALTRCLSRLADARRRAVMLHLQGHSVAETSAFLACDRKKAENLIYRGLADLRACLASQGVAP